MDTVTIVGMHDPADMPWSIVVDDYVPISFRTYDKPIGGIYLRFGRSSTMLAEIIADPVSHAIRGLTLILFESFVPWPDIETGSPVEGLPVVRKLWEGDFYEIMDLDSDFYVALGENELLIGWGEVTGLSAGFVFGNVEFIIAGDELRGVRLFGLTDEQSALLASYPEKYRRNRRQGSV